MANIALNVALSDCNRAIELAGKDPWVWNAYDSRAAVRLRRAEYAAAVDDETRALKLSPDQAQGLLIRALAESAEGSSTEAAADEKAALAIDPRIVETLAKWGMGAVKP